MTMDGEARLTNHEIDLIHGEASVGWLTIGDMNEVPNRLWITDHELIGQAVQAVLAKRVAQAKAEALMAHREFVKRVYGGATSKDTILADLTIRAEVAAELVRTDASRMRPAAPSEDPR